MNADETLREGRLVFYRGGIEQIDRILNEFLRRSGARSAYLIDKSGHLVTQVGELGQFNADTISALVAGAFAATREMARLLGEREFSALFHQGAQEHIQLSLVGDRCILTVLFDDSTTLGMVRLYVNEAARRLVEVFEQGVTYEESGMKLSDAYGNDAQRTLDNLFEE